MSLSFRHYWNKPYYRYSLLMVASIALLLATAICSYLYLEQLKRSADHSAQIYGDSLVQLASEQSASSTFDKDPISLQAIARKIASKSAIVSLIIYDNHNQILAQMNGKVGSGLDQPEDIIFFTAPIVASDNIIGSITMGISPSHLQARYSILWLIIPHVALAALVLLFAWLAWKNPEQDTPNNATTASSAPEVTEPNPVITTTEQQAIYLLLHIKNTHVLYQQLNAESRQQQFNALEQHIQQAAKLYNGKIAAIDEDSIVLSFIGDDTDSIYNALYSGELILKLNQQKSRSVMVINGFIQKPLLGSLGAEMCDTQKSTEQKEHQLFIEPAFLSTYNLNSHLDTEVLPGSKLVMVKQFKGSYATLLENQLTQLQSQQ